MLSKDFCSLPETQILRSTSDWDYILLLNKQKI